METRPRFIFFGTANQLSLSAFNWLITGGAVPLAAVVTAEAAGRSGDAPLEQLYPAPSSSQLPLLNRYHETTLIQAAWSAVVPLFAVSKSGSQALGDMVARLRPEAACVVCFPRRLPLDLISLPPLGFLNVHPSVLPYHRGPAPLFWLFQQQDLSHRGVTVHKMDAGLDTGPVVRQEPIRFADGLDQVTIEHQCGQVGGRLLLEAMRLLSSGRQASPQTGQGSYFPWPVPADFRLQPNWPALRAFNFMRATNAYQMPYLLMLAGQHYSLVEPLAVDPRGQQDMPMILEEDIAHIQFKPGILKARLAPF